MNAETCLYYHKASLAYPSRPLNLMFSDTPEFSNTHVLMKIFEYLNNFRLREYVNPMGE
jgi:hypothetical protein